MISIRTVFFVALIILAQWATAETPQVLRIGVHEKPPYATKNASGEWDGIGVELWKIVAGRLGLRYELVEMPLGDILPAIAAGRLDAAVGEMTINADDESLIHFTQPYITSTHGVAIHPKLLNTNWRVVAAQFFNWTLVLAILAILAGMIIVSLVLWGLERGHSHGHFHGGLRGFGSALWFSASTVTGVGYGDKIPSTFIGRLVTFIWMMMGVLLIAGFTATVASSMSAATSADIAGKKIREVIDLRHYSCGVLRGSRTSKYLTSAGIPSLDYETFDEAFQDLAAGKIDAVVGDKVCLSFSAKQWNKKKPPVHFSLSSVTSENIFIGIPVRKDLPLYDDINRSLLKTTASETWQKSILYWLGERGF